MIEVVYSEAMRDALHAIAAAKAARQAAWDECARRWPAIVQAEEEGGFFDSPTPSATIMADYEKFQNEVVKPAIRDVQSAEAAFIAVVEAANGDQRRTAAVERRQREDEALADARRRQIERNAPGGSEHSSNIFAFRNREERLANEMRRDD